MTHWELINTETRDGFEVRMYAAPEETSFNEGFWGDYDENGAETARAIEEGRLAWFMVKVAAYRLGIELGSDYLGGCAYESASDFLDDLYYEDMAAAAISEARQTLVGLAVIAEATR